MSEAERRASFIKDFIKRFQEADERLPLLTLAEFFDGNADEESLAPNQWGYGRPALAGIWQRLRGIEARSDVAWVRVQLHPDTQACEITGEAIAICTTAATEEIDRAADTESLCSDGVIEGWALPVENFVDIPDIPQGYRVVSLVWDCR
jgi:hypothetical protein